ncbi:efflux RND transporter periplasmic adaptor subunit [Thalassotalea fonticola]|uniref:Efflux RND transporter periplasmic adaptor subunit n=1 Tax=Thalassotalea fonticola TaxID=3065649 RepID=A0ABZ0GSB5_9GAMM|nr:efflux RND transporter periplasmic adaptor subunit [Colwelliaceae bacterium S1-1]
MKPIYSGRIVLVALLLAMPFSFSQASEEDGHNHAAEEQQSKPNTVLALSDGDGILTEANDEDHESAIELSTKQVSLAGIKVETLTAKIMHEKVYAPTEIKANGYTSYVVSPRVDSIVLKRHVALGEHVVKGQPLVTLFSEVIAQAEADYRIYYNDWLRVQNIDKSAVSEKSISEAETRYNAALASLKAFGLSTATINQLSKDNASPLGQYTLEAIQSGSVLSDDFQQGQRVESGKTLMVLADESELWVEAKLSPSVDLALPAGTKATLTVYGTSYVATVIQEAHTIDPETRTRIVRLSVNNDDHKLHAGMFGDVFFNLETATEVIAVPETALMRGSDGDWLVFIEDHPGEFIAKEVELGRSLGEFREISGIASGLNVVMQGAFFIASEQAKGGFDPHNH